MAVEAKRGCGYRKLGGLYMVADPLGAPCDRLPIPIERCPCCGEGIKFSRAWTWIDPIKMFGGDHSPCGDTEACPACYPTVHFGDPDHNRAGLLWVGDKSYTPEEFTAEANLMGISRRIPAIPRGFKAGETWVFFAHIKACSRPATPEEGALFVNIPGVFLAVRPRGFEKIVKASTMENYTLVNEWTDHPELHGNMEPEWTDNVKKDYEEIKALIDRGIKPVPVPDDDPDHCPNGEED